MARKILIESITAGFLIGLGGTVFLSVDNKIIGSILFSMGLLAICVTGQCLFTGKVSYEKDVLYLLTVLVGNCIGAVGTGMLISFCSSGFVSKAYSICQNKLNEGWKVVLLGILCNLLIFFAVEGYKNGNSLLLIMCVSSFILCGFEHCIANIFYFSAAKIVAPWYLFLNILGNSLGGIIVHCFRILKTKPIIKRI